MDWQRCFYNGNLKSYIDTCRKLLLKLESVSIKVPNALLSYSLLGKLAGDLKLHQFIESLTLNKELIEKPDLILTRLQDYVHLPLRELSKPLANISVSALVSASNNNFKIIYYCTNGKHNLKNTSHRKDQCWAENPHLRPNQKENKKRKYDSSAYLSIVKALITVVDSPPKDQILFYCGATNHMFNSRRFFNSLTNSAPIDVSTGEPTSSLTAVGCNLISFLALFKNELIMNKCGNKFDLETNGKVIANGKIVKRLIYADYTLPTTHLTTSQDSLWHNILGHPGKAVLERLRLPAYKSKCTVCALNKAHKQPFLKSFEEAINPLDFIHLNIDGPIHPISISGFQYFLTIIDQATSFKIVKFLKKKSNAFEEFCSVKNFMENQQNRKIKKVISDWGGEFLNKDCNQLAKDFGFLHFFSPPETPQHNGFSERANRTILNKTRCLLGSSHLPNNNWEEAVNTAVLLLNLSPNQSTDNTLPHQPWTGSAPRIQLLKTFGCQAFITLPQLHCSWKLGPLAIEGILLGYDNDNTSYCILRLNDLKVAVTKHATFNEEQFPVVQRNKEEELVIPMQESPAAIEEELSEEKNEDPMNSTLVGESQVTESQELPSEMVDEVHAEEFSSTKNSNHPTVPHIKVIGPRHQTMIHSETNDINILPYCRRGNTHLTTVNRTPHTYQEALKAPDKDLWVAEINKELNLMKQLRVWDLVQLQESYKLIGTTWVFKIKNNPSNGTSEYKARLCAQGFSQTQGIDYQKTYAPTGRLNSLRALIAFAAVQSL
ncbi:hypothetical protein O181_061442 [Austropuccinia psidii MF-1]|uniref:Integrase catalytic domain-containing protein n=1 Tax=Austropuccinia psidii MF-1 TaxID=1389203 RepID=A0A9Q3HZD2_9BASI|nr:hypothetical protein [Austropuccinia psidii MF-1]